MPFTPPGFGGRHKSRLFTGVVTGLCVALLGVCSLAIPPIAHLEPDVGLKWLFELRGARPAPEEVVVVSIDRNSSDELQLPNIPRKWPRQLHANLVRTLHAAGATVIGFDIFFSEHKDARQDREFARAMQDAGNVILFEYLTAEKVAMSNQKVNGVARIERRIAPVAELASSAAATAPFNLPKIPERVNQTWLFKPGAGDYPSLPVAALHQHLSTQFPALKRAIRIAVGDRELPNWLNRDRPPQNPALFALNLREFLLNNVEISNRLKKQTARESAELRSLLHAHTADNGNGIFLDFYGPPGSIATVPYHQALVDSGETSFRGKAVFVGFSERLQPEQKDGFYTVFTNDSGLDISGVEIMATTFANLLERRTVKPLAPAVNILIIVLFGLSAGFLLCQLQGVKAVLAAASTAALYLGISLWLFNGQSLWAPLVIPLLIQLPFSLLFALLCQFAAAQRERNHLHQAFKQYVPEHVATSAALTGFNNMEKQLVTYGVCLSSDAADYTALAEKLSPRELHNFLNDYFQQVFPPVQQRNGVVIDIAGDAMLSVWLDGPKKNLRHSACMAALEIQKNLNKKKSKLPTRIGLHCGIISIGNVGAGKHVEYRVVGDVVNTVSRIEGLNKLLGTQILVSTEVLADLCITSREVGTFRLKGKQQPVTLHELGNQSLTTAFMALFAEGLQQIRQHNWEAANPVFCALLKTCPHDGPSLFYRDLTENMLKDPDTLAIEDGIVNISQK